MKNTISLSCESYEQELVDTIDFKNVIFAFLNFYNIFLPKSNVMTYI